MSIFIKRDELVAVSLPDDPQNVVWIKRKMDVGTRNRVQDALVSLRKMDDKGNFGEAGINMGSSNTVLLINNIVKWEGEKFRDDPPPKGTGMPMPCTPANIEMMDPEDPLLDLVLSEINRLNTKAQVINPTNQEVMSPLPPTSTASESGDTASKATQKP